MDLNNEKQCNKVIQEAENNRGRSEARSTPHQREIRQTRSRSRTPNNIVAKRWISSNAFINFIKDFRQNHKDVESPTALFQLAGQRWKEMSTAERQQYINTTNSTKPEKSDQNQTGQTTKTSSAVTHPGKEQKHTGNKTNEPKKDECKDTESSDTESIISSTYSASASSVTSADTDSSS